MYVVAKALLQSLGVEVVVPPPSSRRTLELGVKHSPEFACLPLKVNIGNFIEAIEAGADTIVMGGGIGPCRFGYYAEVQRQILADLGYNCRLIVIEPPQGKAGEFLRQIGDLTGHHSLPRVALAIRFAWEKLIALEAVEKAVHRVRPWEERPGETTKVYRQAVQAIDAAGSRAELRRVRAEALAQIGRIPQRERGEAVRIGIVGEVYMVLEPFLNYDVEQRLEEMGVEANRSIFLGEWVHSHLLLDALRLRGGQDIARAAQPYLNHFVGGHGLETVAQTVLYAQKGYDGVIQIAPFTCMPEIVAESILPRVSEDLGIPVLTLFIDEHSGEAGCLTRLEAFVDLLARRKEQRRDEQYAGISGH